MNTSIKSYIYRAYTTDGKFVCEAYSRVEMARALGCAKSTITDAYKNNRLVLKKYILQVEEQYSERKTPIKNKEVKEKPKKKTKEEMEFDYLFRLLGRFGNTTFHNDASKYAPMLEEKGIKFKAIQIQDNKGKKGRPKYHYILEVI